MVIGIISAKPSSSSCSAIFRMNLSCVLIALGELGRMMLHFLFFPVSRVQGQRRLVSLTSWPQGPILRLKKSSLLTREVHANTHGCKLTVFCVMKLIMWKYAVLPITFSFTFLMSLSQNMARILRTMSAETRLECSRGSWCLYSR